jgi:hypothetical protein
MRLDNLLFMNIASNWNVDGSGATYGPIQWRTHDQKMRRNICAAACDTAASLIAANRTIPSYQTSNGNFSVARKAIQRARVIHAQMWQLGAFELGLDAFYDGAYTGTGATHGCIDPNTGLPKLVRVMPNSLFVDAAEGRTPRSIYWVHFVPREVLKAVYPKHRFDLEDSTGPSAQDFEDFFIREDNRADLVKVVEAWHLPSKRPKKKKNGENAEKTDGFHVITTSNCTILHEEHDRDRFPFAFYHYAKRRAGFFGQGLIERTVPAQKRICELQKVVDQCQDLASNAVYLIEETSNVHADEISNLPGTALYYQRTRPELVVWQGTPGDIKAEIQQIANEVFEQEGLSPGMVGGELVQKGLGSARAVRAADDVASRRQVIPTRALESYYLQVARLIEDLNDDCAANDNDYAVRGYVRAGRQQFLTTSKWADLAIPEGDCTITVMSMSATPTTPQGRMAAVEEYIAGGFMSKPVALSLMEFPDIDAWQSLETADLDLVEWQIEQLLDMKEEDIDSLEARVLPIPNQDPALARDLMNKAYLVAYRMKAPYWVQDAMLDYIDYADQLMDEAAAKAAEKAALAAPQPEQQPSATTSPEQAAPMPMAA